MSHSSTTANYLAAVKNLKPLTSQKLFASGLELTLRPIGKDSTIAEIQLDGEAVDALKTVINCSVARILTFRKALLQSEIRDIDAFFAQPS